MKLTWRLIKKRGNIRPELSYSVVLEEHEKALALPALRIDSLIPEPVDSWQEHCYPHENERAEKPAKGVYQLEIPSHKGRKWEQTLRLPWREGNEYPEIEASFHLLREAFEKELQAAYASAPIDRQGSLTCTAEAKASIAPAVLAERFLSFAAKGRSPE